MNATLIGLIVLLRTGLAAGLGFSLRGALPEQNLFVDGKDTVKVAAGMGARHRRS